MRNRGAAWFGGEFALLAAVSLLTLGGCADDDGDDAGGGGDGGNRQGYCAATNGWDSSYSDLEKDVLKIVNQRRSEGANCGSKGTFDPAPALKMNDELRCAARVHSLDMVERDYFDHTNPDGDGPAYRVDQAEYDWRTWGENIAAGSSDAEGTMQQWMNSDGHCANIMNPAFEELGVGYYPGTQYGHVWTQVFGAPR